jgi:hypothetical protein
VVIIPLEQICRRNLEELEIWAKEVLEYCKFSLVGNSGGSPEDQNADRNVNCKNCL